ncbi:MAG TPA: 2-dehydropantoate 2-reductase N-terminal domain-containing protein, partial [Xanthobacteraceae bacterium]
MTFDTIAVVGAGAWGTALANALARAGRSVTLWDRDADVVEALAQRRESPHLPGARVDQQIAPTHDLAAALRASAVLLVVPAQAVRAVANLMRAHLRDGTPVVACAKGIERGSGRFMTEVLHEALPDCVPAILSGPSFADDVARGLPTAVTLASAEAGMARALASACGSATFRPYHSTDVRGVEIGGAAKNVLAIAAGIVAGRRLGASAAAALT